jgi:hypothetical protein
MPLSNSVSRLIWCDVLQVEPARCTLQGYLRFAFIGKPGGAPGPYFIDFGNECEPGIDHGPQQRRADSDQVRQLKQMPSFLPSGELGCTD